MRLTNLSVIELNLTLFIKLKPRATHVKSKQSLEKLCKFEQEGDKIFPDQVYMECMWHKNKMFTMSTKNLSSTCRPAVRAELQEYHAETLRQSTFMLVHFISGFLFSFYLKSSQVVCVLTHFHSSTGNQK